ncbi:MAG: Glycosyl transferase family 2 [Candidatus Gottesmanbacteria bacterium GW2011_GWA2_42_18]|uniref:Glycosyl transferase family 2 n=3 Tax=Microgenomates group TaxID=1794810 RepID=A0A0G1C7N4_9BACT|nr:MAG: Glycosyl transferase family 2 [Candidatus Gottesmanbacteria bacterium GW2011_GWA2_42_18]
MNTFRSPEITLKFPLSLLGKCSVFVNRYALFFLIMILSGISLFCFMYYLNNGLGIAYNDARSHLDIGRRVVEGLKPGLAQLGSVWLPLPHLLTVPTIWNDFMWHSGLAGALQSMISFVGTALLIYFFLLRLGVGLWGRLTGVLVFVANINVLYLQSTAMTELLLLATMTAGVYELLIWSKTEKILPLIKSSFWIMLSTLIRYDGWFLLLMAACLIFIKTFKEKGYKPSEGIFLFFSILGGLGVIMWVLWNQLIFKDALYFIFGPYSARAQQTQLEEAGVLATKGDFFLSLKIYFYALMYNSYGFTVILGIIGAVFMYLDKKIPVNMRLMLLTLLAPFIFNVLALYLGHSVLFIQGVSGGTWFNARYGIMMMPSLAVFIGYLMHRTGYLKYSVLGLWLFVTVFAFANQDAVTLDDARVGSSQKNVSEVSGWLREHTKDEEGFILISAASHDAIIFSSGLPMKRFIHEGTGKYWESATTTPDRWARWIIMRTYDMNDLTFNTVSKTDALSKYDLVGQYPFADIYELKPEYISQLNTKPIYGKQK